MYQFIKSAKQANKMETFENYDACGLQISPNFKENIKGKACNAAIVRTKITENANKVFRTPVEKVQYENHVCNLY